MKKWTLLLLAGLVTACHSTSDDVEISLGEVIPAALGGDSTDVLFVTTIEECFSCRIQGGFVALRTAGSLEDSGIAALPRLTALVIVRKEGDSAKFARTLQEERITARVRTVPLALAERTFNLQRIPAIYVLSGGKVARMWESGGPAFVSMGRNEVKDALGRLRAGVPQI